MKLQIKGVSVFLACLLLTATLGFAQVSANNLVNVNVSNIKTDIAKNINVDASQIPVTVQAPVDVAAAVCGVSVAALTSQVQQGSNTCTAKNDSSALNTIIQDQLNNQKNK